MSAFVVLRVFAQRPVFRLDHLACLILQSSLPAQPSLYEEETSGPPMPFSPGWLVAELSMPTLERPESDATGASPGLGAFSADPTPCSTGRGQEQDMSTGDVATHSRPDP